MKKIYNQPEWKVSLMQEEDVITSSGEIKYGSDDMFNSDAESWEW
jgi:hypothetical protein